METARQSDPPPGRDQPPGPDWRAIAVLALAALTLVATSARIPTLEGDVIGEVVIGPGETVQRELHVHLDPSAGGATDGSISVEFQAASGLEPGYTNDATVGFAGASDATGAFPATSTFPRERCIDGCDLVYTIAVTAAPTVLPGSVARYRAQVRLQYAGSGPAPNPASLRMELDGAATGPVAPIWAIAAGLLALAMGIGVGPWLDARSTPARRRLPGLVAMAVPLAMVMWILGNGVTSLAGAGGPSELGAWSSFLFVVGDPWSVGLLLTLAWGVWRGLRRWPEDGGWLLGIAATALVGLGGLWWAWWSTATTVIQPAVLGASFVLLGAIGGVVIGQAWRTDARARHDRGWATIGVLSHGVVIAGFGFLAERSLFDPFASTPSSLVLLVPMTLVAVAFGRWLYGRQRWLIAFDLIIAALGVLGGFLMTSTSTTVGSSPGGLVIEDVAIAIAVVASLVALVASLHAMPPRVPTAPIESDDARETPAEPISPGRAVADPPTS